MDAVIIDILQALRETGSLDAQGLDRIVRKHSKLAHDGRKRFAKKHILAFYLETKRADPEHFSRWNVSEDLDRRFVGLLKMKPRRTASGVATITVITKPWPCSSNCVYCPCDIRMPKSYLHDEPACQRAERNFFDPYLQIASRLRALENMGHATDKIELIILGGSWTDYPRDYQTWFVNGLFEALNDPDERRIERSASLAGRYATMGLASEPQALQRASSHLQESIDNGTLSFNEAFEELYEKSEAWIRLQDEQRCGIAALRRQHEMNETSAHRVVGLVVETRPDTLDDACLAHLRELGCTKIQMGVQSTDDALLRLNGRASHAGQVRRAFESCRLFGFKIHAHFMLNLYGSSPDDDKADYLRFVTDHAFKPDEVKLYPCALVSGTALVQAYRNGLWHPYTEEELVDVLSHDMLATPPYTRVSRMIRDISAKDILAGNKKTNLRQLVEQALDVRKDQVKEIRFREIGTQDVALDTLRLDDIVYATTLTTEHFLQWVTPDNAIAGFLRLSLPNAGVLDARSSIPLPEGSAMIREVHVYGFAAQLDSSHAPAQHHGLGRHLVERACTIAHDAGYTQINVISAIGTREYYRRLGFVDAGLYQRKPL